MIWVSAAGAKIAAAKSPFKSTSPRMSFLRMGGFLSLGDWGKLTFSMNGQSAGSTLHQANRWYPSGTSNSPYAPCFVNTTGVNSTGKLTSRRVPSVETLSQL